MKRSHRRFGVCSLALYALFVAGPANAQYSRSPYSGRSSGGRTSSSRGGSSRQGSESTSGPAGQIYAVPEEDGNTVMIIGPPRHFEAIQKILAELDTAPAQVLVQAMFVEVSLTDALDWQVSGTIFRTQDFIKALDRETGRTFADIGTVHNRYDYDPSNQDFTFRVMTHRFEAVLKALKTITDINVVSRPQILVSDNQEAEFFVGENTPFVTNSQTSAEGASVRNTIQYENVGISLRVTPHINPDGIVNLDVYPEIARRSESTIQISEDLNASVFPTRSAATIVSVKDGQTIVLGGLIENKETDIKTRVPILGSIPLLGWLFRGVDKKVVKTELLIFVTPRVVTTPEELQDVSDAEKERSGISDEPPKMEWEKWKGRKKGTKE